MLVRFHAIRPGEFPARTKGRRGSTFSVSWSQALGQLENELVHLGAKNIVIQVALNEDDIRLDGWPKAGARPSHPGVIVSFQSKHGSLRYFCDEYDEGQRYGKRNLVGYQANLRAIGLGLAALRAVDRYGFTKRGEQYTGFKALGTGDGLATRQEAEVILRKMVMSVPCIDRGCLIEGEHRIRPRKHLGHPRDVAHAAELALWLAHPDHGGSTEQFEQVQRARRVLGANP